MHVRCRDENSQYKHPKWNKNKLKSIAMPFGAEEDMTKNRLP
jgi:hypothetical protein